MEWIAESSEVSKVWYERLEGWVRVEVKRLVNRILPLFRRRTKELGETLLGIYIPGLFQRDFELSLRGLLGDSAPLSPHLFSV